MVRRQLVDERLVVGVGDRRSAGRHDDELGALIGATQPRLDERGGALGLRLVGEVGVGGQGVAEELRRQHHGGQQGAEPDEHRAPRMMARRSGERFGRDVSRPFPLSHLRVVRRKVHTP